MLKNYRQLTVARHQELNGNEIDNGGVDGGEEKQPENNADDESEGVTEYRAKSAADEISPM